MVFGELKITSGGRNIGPYTTASLSFTSNTFSSTGGYLKDKLLMERFFLFLFTE